jgi:predicted enzyme related to lactoylglutathione lyase
MLRDQGDRPLTTIRMPRLALLTLFVALPGLAQQDDVTFFVIGKHTNVAQDMAGGLTPVDFSFFSEIFLTDDGNADAATLTFPGGERVPFRDMRAATGGDRDNLLLVAGEDRYTNVDDLQRRYPDGEYRISFTTPGGPVDGSLVFRDRPLPEPPVISVLQAGRPCLHLEPGIDAEVRWSGFAEGGADPHGILDDLIFVILSDADGRRVAHSGRPFSGAPYLTYAADSFVIDGEVLEPNASYTLSVEHALLDDTMRVDGVPAFTTRAVTTKLELSTAGTGSPGCAAPEPALQSQVTMFYYDDIDAAARFYGETLGLDKTLDWDWVRFYRTGPSSSVGIVRAGDGAWHEPQRRNAVMLSLVSRDVDAWYERIRGKPGVVLLKDIASGGGIRSFLLEDPGGYTVEFFEWLDGDGE